MVFENIIDSLVVAFLVQLVLLVPAYIIFKLNKGRMTGFIQDQIDRYVTSFLQNMEKHPEVMISVLKPAIDKLLRQYGIQNPGTGGDENIKVAGWKIPGWAGKLIANVLTRKMGGLVENAAQIPVEG